MKGYKKTILASTLMVSSLATPVISQAAPISVHGHVSGTLGDFSFGIWAWLVSANNVATPLNAFMDNDGINTFNFDQSEVVIGTGVNADTYTIDSGLVTFAATDTGDGNITIAVQEYSFTANILPSELDRVPTFGDSISASLSTGGSATFASGDFTQGLALTGLDSQIEFSTSQGAFVSTLDVGGTLVPLPAAIWLFGSGLIGLIGFARHKAHT